MRLQEQRDRTAGDGSRLAGPAASPQATGGLRLRMRVSHHRAGRQHPQHVHAAGHQVGLTDAGDGPAAAERRHLRCAVAQVRCADREGLRVEAGIADLSGFIAG